MDGPEREKLEALPEAIRRELEDHVELCIDLVEGIDADVKLYETKIQSDLLEEHGGTVDVIAFDGRTLHIVDFKFGRVKVNIEGNSQIKCYLNLARQLFPDAKRFLGSIIQPEFSDKMQTREFILEELLEHEAAVLEASISDNLVAGDHCQWCPAAPQCKVLAKYVKKQVDDFPDLTETVASVQKTPTSEQVEELCKIYKTFKLVEKATSGASDILKRWAREGANIEAHGLGIRVTNRVGWSDKAEEILVYKGIESSVYFKQPTLVTPKELRDALCISREDFEKDFAEALESKEIHSLIMGRNDNEFPEFD